MLTQRIALPIILVSLCFAACDDWKSSPLDFNHTIVVINNSVCDVIVLLDDEDRLEIPAGGARAFFENVEEGRRVLSAYVKDSDTSEPFEEIVIYVSERKDYTWALNDCPV